MKPLVYYCRWQGALLRLRGRDQTAVWGQLVFNDDVRQEDALQERTVEFRYLLETAELFLGFAESQQHLFLDKKGIPLTG